MDSQGRTIWIADAHHGDGKRFVVRADEKLTAFFERELAIRTSASDYIDGWRKKCTAFPNLRVAMLNVGVQKSLDLNQVEGQGKRDVPLADYTVPSANTIKPRTTRK